MVLGSILGTILASKSYPKIDQKIDRILDGFWKDFGSHMGSKLGPFWLQKSIKNQGRILKEKGDGSHELFPVRAPAQGSSCPGGPLALHPEACRAAVAD